MIVNAIQLNDKASIITYGQKKMLQSYSTIVCGIKENEFIRLWDGHSVTTMKHINMFREHFGLPKMTKKDWDKLPVERGI